MKRIEKLLLPGEAQSYGAYDNAGDVVRNVAERHLGFKTEKGYRPATARERISEWDALSITQRNAIIAKKGIQWYLSQAEEIERLREALSDVTAPIPTPESA